MERNQVLHNLASLTCLSIIAEGQVRKHRINRMFKEYAEHHNLTGGELRQVFDMAFDGHNRYDVRECTPSYCAKYSTQTLYI